MTRKQIADAIVTLELELQETEQNLGVILRHRKKVKEAIKNLYTKGNMDKIERIMDELRDHL